MCRGGVGRAEQAWGLSTLEEGESSGLRAFSLPHTPVFPLVTVSALGTLLSSPCTVTLLLDSSRQRPRL